MSRKKSLLLIMAGVLVLALLFTAGCGTQQKSAAKTEGVNSEEAMELLAEGNARYLAGNLATKDLGLQKREELAKGQKPFAVIVTCSDSRVPPELLFDQGLGNIFIIRVAGNVVDPIGIGSVEYAAEHLGSPLVVVLGHSHCGAVKATVEGGEAPGSIGAIVAKIKPSVDKAKAEGITEEEQLLDKAIDLNVEATVAELLKSPILKELEEHGKLEVIGATYDISSGQVHWLGENEATEKEAH